MVTHNPYQYRDLLILENYLLSATQRHKAIEHSVWTAFREKCNVSSLNSKDISNFLQQFISGGDNLQS